MIFGLTISVKKESIGRREKRGRTIEVMAGPR